MKKFRSQSGYSLVEVLVAISILLLATVGPMTIAARSLQYAEFSAQQNTAYFLAQEGIEAVFKVRADAGIANIGGGDPWTWVASELGACEDSNGCGLDWRNESSFVWVSNCSNPDDCLIYFNDGAGRARYSHDSGGVPTAYSRVVELEEIVGSEQVRVRSTVSWDMHPSGQPQEVVLETYLHNIYDFTP